MNKTLSIASLLLCFLSAACLSSCQPSADRDAAPAAPLTEMDLLINDYEKTANEYVRVARKHQAGDVSLTLRVIELRKDTRDLAAKVQVQAAKLNPTQAQRAAAIAAKTAPYLPS